MVDQDTIFVTVTIPASKSAAYCTALRDRLMSYFPGLEFTVVRGMGETTNVAGLPVDAVSIDDAVARAMAVTDWKMGEE